MRLSNGALALIVTLAIAVGVSFSPSEANAQSVVINPVATTTTTTTTDNSTTVTSVSYATGALSFGRVNGKTVTTTLAGYSGTINGVPTYNWGLAKISLNGFIGLGTTSNSGGTTYAVGLYPNFAIGSLSIGAGIDYNNTTRKGELLFTGSFGINL